MASFGVTGMTCPACATSIEKALRALKGVQAADVSYEKTLAVVTFDPTQVKPDALIAAVQSAGGTGHRFDVGQLPGPEMSRPETNRGKMIPADLLSFYPVPLVCQAAPEIGCGSRAKPILLILGTRPEVSGAWLNRQGTVLAINWVSETPLPRRREVAAEVLKEHGIEIEEMTGEGRAGMLEDFQSDERWYGSEAVDRLSEEEAAVIAARLVARLAAKAALTGETADKLKEVIAGVFRKRLTGQASEEPVEGPEDPQEDILRAAASLVGEKDLAVLREAIALGFRPVAGEP